MTCCGREPVQQWPEWGWCSNCGSIVASTGYTYRPALRLCATCLHWGPDGDGDKLHCWACHGERKVTDGGETCGMYNKRGGN